MSSVNSWNEGSVWSRWEPHIHTPETVLNDGFGAGGWEKYLTAIETASPTVIALGVTDYFTLRGYKKLLAFKRDGRLPNVKFVFPNVELRLDIRTEKAGGGVNLHLLFNPEMPDAIEQIENVLSLLTFEISGDRVYKCTDDDLVKLGRKLRGNTQLEEGAALRDGANQFKVNFDKLREVLRANPSIQRNCIVAIANGDDGLGGVREDAFGEVRKKLAHFADIVFSGSPADREYWLGKKRGFTADKIEATFRSLKPCIHGSDAHRPEQVCRPDKDRYCWIKARPTWGGLRQILAEPEERVFIGAAPPQRTRSNCVRELRLEASWFSQEPLVLNEGIVTIIGPRGSGKTALADLLAVAGDAYEPSDASFLKKAGAHACGAKVVVEWSDGRDASERVVGGDRLGPPRNASICYLSQQFVERLCRNEGEDDRLIAQIERVVFDRLDPAIRGEAMTFAEVRDFEMADMAFEVTSARRSISDLTLQIAEEKKLEDALPAQREKLVMLDAEILSLEKQLGEGIVKGKEQKLEQFKKSSAELAVAEKRVQVLQSTRRAISTLRRELDQSVVRTDQEFSGRRQRLLDVGIEEAKIEEFRQVFRPSAMEALKARDEHLARALDSELGTDAGPPKPGTYGALVSTYNALQKELSADSAREKRLVELTRLIQQKKAERDKLAKSIEHGASANARIRDLQLRRVELYTRVVSLIGDEEKTLERLYAPLLASLPEGGAGGGKIGFYIRRDINVDAWATQGEELLDLRRRGDFNEAGALRAWAIENLVPVWRGNKGADINAEISRLLVKIGDVRASLKPSTTLASFAEWLFSTKHIRVSYGIRYEETEIERLSPGTRGIVLLILYLALDTSDERPLIVDQPEENLDPKSVFSELVGYFRRARERRQVIIVTHNANLVVNTDADQVIVADGVRLPGHTLPVFRYEGGALEDASIRRQVCEILEGGEAAFRRRERRYEFDR